MIRTTLSFIFLTIVFSSAVGQVNQTPTRYGYVFAPDRRYAVVDLVAGRVVATGNLDEVGSVTRAYLNPFGDSMLLQTVSPGNLNAPEPTEQLAVVSQVRDAGDPRLRFDRWLPGPKPSSGPIWAKAVSRSLLVVSWQDDLIHTTLYDATLKAVRTVDNFQLAPTTCLSSDGQTIYSVIHSPKREIKAVNLRSFGVTESSYSSIGNAAAYYKAPMASDGCVVAFIERMSRATQGSSPATIYLHDIEKNRTSRSFSVEGDGRFAMALQRNLLLLDLTTLLPNKLGDGTTVGLRRATAGSLLLYDTETGKEIARIPVPREGMLSGVSSDGRSAYYLSPSLLSVVDLVNKHVTAKVALPFPFGVFVAQN